MTQAKSSRQPELLNQSIQGSLDPYVLLRVHGGLMLAASLCWLLGSFMTYTMIQATAVNITGEVATQSKLGVAVTVCSMLFVIFAGVGISVAGGTRWGWRHGLASTAVWLILGAYLSALWLHYTPFFNEQMLLHNRMPVDAVQVGSRLVSVLIIGFTIVLPLSSFGLLLAPNVRKFMQTEVDHLLEERSLLELILLWGFWGVAMLTSLGILYDKRVLSWGGSPVVMTYFWLLTTVIMILAGASVYTRKKPLMLSSLCAAIASWALALSALLSAVLGKENLLVALPDDSLYREVTVTGFFYFGGLAAIGMLIQVFRPRH